MTNKLDEIIVDAIFNSDETVAWECRTCGQRYDVGRDARQHMFSQHDNHLGIKKVKDD